MDVYIVGEDKVTIAVIRRVLEYCSADFQILLELPARGGQIKEKISKFNILSLSYPVILLTDLDNYNCAPELVKKLIPDKNQDFIFNVAVDEAEAWLMADREGFAKYFKIKPEEMPVSCNTKQGGRTELCEMSFKYKSSLYLTKELVHKINNTEYVQQLTPKSGAKKGPEYNDCILPFIQNTWNIENACNNTNSLCRMINRIKRLIVTKDTK